MLCAVVAVLLSLQVQALPADSPPATAMIAGRVVDAASGAPLPGATVSLSGTVLRGATTPRLMTDSQGRFVYRHLPEGA